MPARPDQAPRQAARAAGVAVALPPPAGTGAAAAPSREAEIVAQVLGWFSREGRDWPWRRTRDRWTVLVSEVCLQQTQVERAAPYVERLLAAYPTPADLAAAPLAEILGEWQGLGYPRRARNLHAAAQVIATTGWPDDLQALPGVGPYTDAALRCFADGEAVMPPDINTRRVLARLFPAGAPGAADVDEVGTRAWHWGQAVMELGQTACRARARCEVCPVAESCPSVGTDSIVASPRQSRFAGSMRQRRGTLLRTVLDEGRMPADRDPAAAASLLADGLVLAMQDDDGAWLTPPA